MNKKIEHSDLKNFKEGDFRINSDLEVFFGKQEIGSIRIIKHEHPEGDDEIVCFLPGGMGFQHYPVSDAGSACQTIYDKFYNRR